MSTRRWVGRQSGTAGARVSEKMMKFMEVGKVYKTDVQVDSSLVG